MGKSQIITASPLYRLYFCSKVIERRQNIDSTAVRQFMDQSMLETRAIPSVGKTEDSVSIWHYVNNLAIIFPTANNT